MQNPTRHQLSGQTFIKMAFGFTLVAAGIYIFWYVIPLFISFVTNPQQFFTVKTIMSFENKSLTLLIDQVSYTYQFDFFIFYMVLILNLWGFILVLNFARLLLFFGIETLTANQYSKSAKPIDPEMG